MPLSKLPPVDRLSLATVTSVPEWHAVMERLTSGITRIPLRSPRGHSTRPVSGRSSSLSSPACSTGSQPET